MLRQLTKDKKNYTNKKQTKKITTTKKTKQINKINLKKWNFELN